MKLKKMIQENWLLSFIRQLPNMFSEYASFVKSHARSNQSKISQKKLTDILMLTHALEKGFSLPNMRKSFGFDKALSLAYLIKDFITKYDYSYDLNVPICILKYYLNYHDNNSIEDNRLKEIHSLYSQISIMAGNRVDTNQTAGAIEKSKEEMITIAHADFETLAENRFSVRTFDSTPVPYDIITKALKIASKSPSACNRQSYRVHIFEGNNKNCIMSLQGGGKSFMDNVDKVILINADLNKYYSREIHLGYVDASLFAMSLIYALTYLGIGTIPLTLGIGRDKLSKLKRDFNIPSNEMPVILIAIGNYADSFKVAISHRNPVEYFTTYHK